MSSSLLSAVNDAPEMDLPGMWSLSDFMGGDPDERPYAERGWPLKCDNCGKFASRLHPVWCNPPSGGIDREVCDSCVIPPGKCPTCGKAVYYAAKWGEWACSDPECVNAHGPGPSGGYVISPGTGEQP